MKGKELLDYAYGHAQNIFAQMDGVKSLDIRIVPNYEEGVDIIRVEVMQDNKCLEASHNPYRNRIDYTSYTIDDKGRFHRD